MARKSFGASAFAHAFLRDLERLHSSSLNQLDNIPQVEDIFIVPNSCLDVRGTR